MSPVRYYVLVRPVGGGSPIARGPFETWHAARAELATIHESHEPEVVVAGSSRPIGGAHPRLLRELQALGEAAAELLSDPDPTREDVAVLCGMALTCFHGAKNPGRLRQPVVQETAT